jgi:C-terminal processing protease CtpA/Prc
MRPVRTSLAVLAVALAGSTGALEAQRTPGWIGIGFEVKAPEAGADGVSTAVVTEVRSGSPAAGAGIEVGDVLLTINDVSTVRDFENLSERLALRVGDRVRIRLERNGRRLELTLRAAERPADFAMWMPEPAMPTDSMAEEMFRAIDSLRVQILAATRMPAPPSTRSPRARLVANPGAAPVPPQPIEAPFEFFIFRGQQHDSLRLEMESLNRRLENLRDQEQRLTERRRERRSEREMRALDAQLEELGEAIAEVTGEAATLRAAMSESARATAGNDYFMPAPTAATGATDATFRPLTPYLLGSNRVAGAEVVDVRPGLAEYFGVETGVLVVDVAPGTPAAIAGIRPGDVIMNLDRVSVRSVDELRAGISRAGDALPVTLVRRGSRLEVLLRRR